MRRTAEILNAAHLAGWAVVAVNKRGLAGESAVASRPAGSAAAVLDTLVAAGAALGRRRYVPRAINGKLHEVR